MSVSPVSWIQWLIYIPTIALGLPLNLSALWTLFFRIRRFTETTVYLTSLVINDILLIFSLPFKMYAYERTWNLGSGFCSFLESLIYINIYGSILFIVCISVDRYIMLRFPYTVTKFRSPQKAAVVSLVIWILIFGVSPAAYTLHDQEYSCFQNFSNTTWNKVGIVASLEIVFSVSTIIMVFCSINVLLILKDLQNQNPQDKKLKNSKSVKIVISNLVTFLVCFIPYHVAVLIYFVAKNTSLVTYINDLRMFLHISLSVSSVNCLFDGICYYYVLLENWQAASMADMVGTTEM